jgi:hypothetical protein
MAVARIKLPADFVARLNGTLTPGATLFVTHPERRPDANPVQQWPRTCARQPGPR